MHRPIRPLRHPALFVPLTAALALAAGAATATSASAATPPSGSAATSQSILIGASTSGLPPYRTWIRDVTAVTDQASAYLADRLPDRTIKPAIVLDIDNTALESKYDWRLPVPATPPVLAVARQARASGAAVFFVTARPEILRPVTVDNLKRVGYPNDGLLMRGFFDYSSNQTMKTNDRIRIEKVGYTIVANIGNSASDLAGGHAERTFKLPDYNGQLD